ncbi:MAG TPA: class I SAM-dependent methyltransferase, partial [Allocoleopsis sp.]
MTPSSNTPLHGQNPLGRFSDRAQDYARYRPTYPAAAIDLILQGLPDPTQLQVADIGAGTGISARLLADRGASVWAIEPNAAMREAATPHPGVTFQEGTAEQTGLPDASVDLVLCAQSFHWFDQSVALTEFHRILKPQGRVALMWNDRNLEDEFTQAYSEIVGRAADRQIFDREDRKSGAALQGSPLFMNFQAPIVFHQYSLDQTSLLGLVLSASYVPKSGAAYEQLITDLHSLYQRWVDRTPGDCVNLSYRVNLYLADRA